MNDAESARFWSETLAQEILVRDRVAHVALCYPTCDPNPHTLQIDLNDVRAADAIRVSYDFARDGWKIEQQEQENLQCESGVIYPAWVQGAWREVAFVPSWALTKTHREEEVDLDAWLERCQAK